jgi:hypothetical protein
VSRFTNTHLNKKGQEYFSILLHFVPLLSNALVFPDSYFLFSIQNSRNIPYSIRQHKYKVLQQSQTQHIRMDQNLPHLENQYFKNLLEPIEPLGMDII